MKMVDVICIGCGREYNAPRCVWPIPCARCTCDAAPFDWWAENGTKDDHQALRRYAHARPIPAESHKTALELSFTAPMIQARCLDCGKDYADFPLDVILPRPQWLAIHPDENGLLCAACIVARCAKVPRATCCHLIIEIAPPRLAAEAPVLPPIEQRLHDTEAQLTAVRGESQRRAAQLDAALERERDLRVAESQLSNAYLRIRELVGAWDTNPGGVDRFEVTERRVSEAVAALARHRNR